MASAEDRAISLSGAYFTFVTVCSPAPIKHCCFGVHFEDLCIARAGGISCLMCRPRQREDEEGNGKALSSRLVSCQESAEVPKVLSGI